MARLFLKAVLLVMAILGSLPGVAHAVEPEDFVAGYEALYIGRAKVGPNDIEPQWLRQTIYAELGFGDLGVGLMFQDAARLDDGRGEGEHAVMLTGRYDPVLTSWLRASIRGRLGLTHHVSNPAQPLYATDTELTGSLIAFDADGIGAPGQQVFLSGHAGASINWVGRPQLIAGLGAWWRQLGFYATGYYSLAGVTDPANAGDRADVRYAYLDAAGLTLAMSWDIDLGEDEALRLEVRQNIPFRNAGFDTVLAIRWAVPLLDSLAAPAEAAW